MDIFHELLEIKDIVEGPAKGGAGEGEPHRVERAVQDDAVHLIRVMTILVMTVVAVLPLPP